MEMQEGTERNTRFTVVVNQKGQYSIWFEEKEPPKGWTPIGFNGSKDDCLTKIAEIWTDMTPHPDA